jgi:hypothetical protein
MKNSKLIIACLLICGVAMFNQGCKKDVDATTQTSTPNLSTQGGIAFIVKNTSGDPVPGAKVGLASSQGDLVTNTYLASRNTNSNGYADLGRFNGGTYYYEVDVNVGGKAHHGEGSVEIRNGEDIVQNLVAE